MAGIIGSWKRGAGMTSIRRWAAALAALALTALAMVSAPVLARGPADVDGVRIRGGQRAPAPVPRAPHAQVIVHRKLSELHELRPAIAKVFELKDLRAAIGLVEKGGQLGKAVLKLDFPRVVPITPRTRPLRSRASDTDRPGRSQDRRAGRSGKR
jgi:hypothetical protein